MGSRAIGTGSTVDIVDNIMVSPRFPAFQRDQRLEASLYFLRSLFRPMSLVRAAKTERVLEQAMDGYSPRQQTLREVCKLRGTLPLSCSF